MGRGSQRSRNHRVLPRLFRNHKGICHHCGRKTVMMRNANRFPPVPPPPGMLGRWRLVNGVATPIATGDHLTPRFRGGAPGIENMVLACDHCNHLRNELDQKTNGGEG